MVANDYRVSEKGKTTLRLFNWIRTLKDYWFIQRKRHSKHNIAVGKHLTYLSEYLDVARQMEASSIDDKLVMNPRLGERTATTSFDRHYFYQDTWALRRICENNPPPIHVDVGSRIMFVGLLSCMVPVEFIDIRPLEAVLPNLTCKKGSVLTLPYESKSLESVSCLHVAEHVGLGRYGDPINIMNGTRLACVELQRVLQRGGRLYFSLPISGENRIEFNAHRVHTVHRILSYFPELELVELSGVTDNGEYIENIEPKLLGQQKYGCGFFLFRRD